MDRSEKTQADIHVCGAVCGPPATLCSVHWLTSLKFRNIKDNLWIHSFNSNSRVPQLHLCLKTAFIKAESSGSNWFPQHPATPFPVPNSPQSRVWKKQKVRNQQPKSGALSCSWERQIGLKSSPLLSGYSQGAWVVFGCQWWRERAYRANFQLLNHKNWYSGKRFYAKNLLQMILTARRLSWLRKWHFHLLVAPNLSFSCCVLHSVWLRRAGNGSWFQDSKCVSSVSQFLPNQSLCLSLWGCLVLAPNRSYKHKSKL